MRANVDKEWAFLVLSLVWGILTVGWYILEAK